MTFRSKNSIDEVENFTRFVIGPVLLASFVSNGVYRTVCEGRSNFVAMGSMATLSPFPIFFALGSVWIAWSTRDLVLRCAWASFGIYQSAVAYSQLTDYRAPAAFAWFGLAAAVLMSVASLRKPAKYRFLAVALFVGATFVFFSLQRYGNILGGRDTVFREAPICRLRDAKPTFVSL